MELKQPCQVLIAKVRRDSSAAQKRRVTDNRIEAGVLAVERLAELDLPVQRHQRRRPAAHLALQLIQFVPSLARLQPDTDRLGGPRLAAVARLWLVRVEEGREDQIADQS